MTSKLTDEAGCGPEVGPCFDCFGARAVPDDFGGHEDGYGPCPSCVIDAGPTFVVYELGTTPFE